MKNKFWVYYLAFVSLLTGIGYFAIANVSNVPLTLSDSEMAFLRGTVGSDERCIRSSRLGCENSDCNQPPIGQATYGSEFNECQSWNGWYCDYRGPMDAQVLCRIVYYTANCDGYHWEENENGEYVVKIRNETTSDCSSRRMR